MRLVLSFLLLLIVFLLSSCDQAYHKTEQAGRLADSKISSGDPRQVIRSGRDSSAN